MVLRLSIPVPSHFNFWRTVYSHGWCSLLPFRVDKERGTFHRVLHLTDGSLADCNIADSGRSLSVEVHSQAKPAPEQRREIRAQLKACLRLEEDFVPFHTEARRYPRYRWISKAGVGRMLRAPTVFEDLVKTICTTNCTWALTTIMVHNLIGELGKKQSDGGPAFPTPQAMAGVSESFMRKHIKSGYRSPYLIEVADNVATGRLDVESWRTSPLSTDELFERIRSVKGMGPYAAGNLLRLLGRYDYLALDSWVRSQYYELHHKGRKVSDKTIERAYRKYGTWRGLFFWLEMTRYWFKKKFPEW